MIQTIKNNLILAIATIVLVFAAMLASASTVNAQDVNIKQGLDCGSNINLTNNTCPTGQGASTLQNTIKMIINIFSVIVGAVAVIMIIIGGFRYITSGGSSEGVSGAKNTILYAIVGLIIVALAQVIVQFVLDKAV